jgi:hypothetical protein
MNVLCYHNGALGHAVMVLIETCTKEGTNDFPSFVAGEHLHHYRPTQTLFCVKHPDCNITSEKSLGNTVISSSSQSHFGRFLILLMGLKKWTKAVPALDHEVTYKQYGKTYGDQLEILSLTLRDKVQTESEWFLDADYVLDVVDFWQNPDEIVKWLTQCGFTPVVELVHKFCKLVSESNQQYYNDIVKCVQVVDDVVKNKISTVDLTFYETAVCHALLLIHFKRSHVDVKLFQEHPTNTQHFIDIFYDQAIS